jgi:hypothetical protein
MIPIPAVFVAAFLFSIPAIAAPPEEASPEAKAEEAKTEDPGTPEAKAEEAKAEEPKAADPAEETKENPGTLEKADSESPAEIKDDDAATAAVKTLIDAARNGQWSLVAALAIMLVVFIAGRLGLAKKLPKSAMPWFAAGTSILGYIAAALMVEGASIIDALAGGFMVGASAVGLWEMVFKHFLKNKATSEPEMKPEGA